MEQEPPKKILVKDIMTKEVMTASPEMSLLDVAKIVSEHNFNGLPVIDKNRQVVGIITEFDLIEKASEITLNTLRNVLRDIHASKDINFSVKDRSEEIYPMKVSDIMTKDPITVSPETTYEEMIDLFRNNQKINPVPVVDQEKKLLGLVSRSDVLRPLGVYGFR